MTEGRTDILIEIAALYSIYWYVRSAVKNLLQRFSVATLSSLRPASIFRYASAVVAVVLSAEEVKNSLVKFISQATTHKLTTSSASSHRSVSLTYLFFYSGDRDELNKIFASAPQRL